MGQYYYICNISKKQYLRPHIFGDGAKLLEFGMSGYGTMYGLSLLLADGNGRGGGDFHEDSELIGSWAGDNIVIAGDYADEGKFVKDKTRNLYIEARETFTNISMDVLILMLKDEYFRKDKRKSHSDCIQDAIKICETDEKDYPLLLNQLETDEAKAYVARKLKEM